jgi:hypothetical protein
MPGIPRIWLGFAEEFEESFDEGLCRRDVLYVRVEISRIRATTPTSQTLNL